MTTNRRADPGSMFSMALEEGLAEHRRQAAALRFDADQIDIKFYDGDPANPSSRELKGLKWTTYADPRVRRAHAVTPTLFETWQAACASVKVGGPIAMRFEVQYGYDREHIHVHGRVKTDDVNKPGEEVDLSFVRLVPSYARERSQMIQYLRGLVLWFFSHEANERIEVDGFRVFVPDEEHG